MENDIKNILIYTNSFLESDIKIITMAEKELRVEQIDTEQKVKIITTIKKSTREMGEQADIHNDIMQVFHREKIEVEQEIKEQFLSSYVFSLLNTMNPETNAPVKMLVVSRVKKDSTSDVVDIIDFKYIDPKETLDTIIASKVKTYKK